MNLEPLKDALAPCPMCGKSVATIWNPIDNMWTVECYDGDGGCMVSVDRRTRAEAIAAWNTRAPDPEIQRMRSVIEAWHDIDRKRDAEVERLKTALEPFVSGYSHTSVFLSSRQKMHPAGQDLYRDDVERAIAALKEPSHED